MAADGSLYIADSDNSCVRRVSPAGVITSLAGRGQEGGFSGDEGPATAAELSDPSGAAVAADGSIYIADKGNNRVRRVSRAGVITTVAGTGEGAFNGDGGPATAAELSQPTGVAVAADGTMYIADRGNSRVRRVSRAGVITTVAGSGDDDPTGSGNGQDGFSGDGGPATEARLSSPSAVALAADRSVYVADRGNSRIRRVSPAGVITTVAGR